MPTRTAGIGNVPMGFRVLALDFSQAIDASTQAEEARTVPGRPSDGAGDGGEAWVCRLAPHVPTGDHRDGVAVPLVLAHEHGAGLEAPGAVRSRPVATCEAIQKLCRIRIKPPEGLLLDVPADEPRDQVLGEGRGRGRPQGRTPQGAKLVEAERPHAVDLGLDRLAIE